MKYKLNWTEAAKNGLILASVSVVINLVTSLLQLPGVLNMVLNFAKFGGSVYLVYYFMSVSAKQYDYVSYGSIFGYGVAVCSLSAIVCTLFYVLTLTVFVPETMEMLLDVLYSTYESMGMAMPFEYEDLASIMPATLAISQFISCIIIGVIVSAIMAAVTKKGENNPFGEFNSEN